MADIQVRRLPVMTRDKRLVGIISLGNIAVMQGLGVAGAGVGGISEPGGDHSRPVAREPERTRSTQLGGSFGLNLRLRT